MLNFFKKKTEWKGNEIYSVVDGRLKKLEKVADPAFAQKMLGDGAAIDPQNELIVAPCEGTITMMYPTLHAFGITNTDGVEILVHIGIDTVAMKGDGFEYLVKEGQKVSAGTPLIKFDKKKISEAGYVDTIICVITEPGNMENIIFVTGIHAIEKETTVAKTE
jgi:PTS system trehalose-specific IIC component